MQIEFEDRSDHVSYKNMMGIRNLLWNLVNAGRFEKWAQLLVVDHYDLT